MLGETVSPSPPSSSSSTSSPSNWDFSFPTLFSKQILSKSVKFLKNFKWTFISGLQLLEFLNIHEPFMNDDGDTISIPFMNYLIFHGHTSSLTSNGHETTTPSYKKPFVHMRIICMEDKGVKKLLDKFVFDFFISAYHASQKCNHQLFLFNLLLRWNGLSIHGRKMMLSTGLTMPKSTFYRRLQVSHQDIFNINLETMSQGPFALWVDNFTKVFSRDYKFYDGDRVFQVNDFTVCGALLAFKPDAEEGHSAKWSTLPFDDVMNPVTTSRIFIFKHILVANYLDYASDRFFHCTYISKSGIILCFFFIDMVYYYFLFFIDFILFFCCFIQFVF